ncbi:uncharacterized protein LOC118433593 [Folsomia candida]|uniref:uncharacterized protein LOC118433593 n=1 Tax=Folsomia candida TaxID=158441 RepID=UPI001604D2D5|nr:uncharacterized protein LOC118433593 [Folsomia candida]
MYVWCMVSVIIGGFAGPTKVFGAPSRSNTSTVTSPRDDWAEGLQLANATTKAYKALQGQTDNLVKEDANQLLESSLLLFNGNTTSLRDNGTRFQTAIDKLEDTTIRLGTKQGDIGT